MPQDPAAIQQQIEQTRAELAETIDAIAEIVSPRRVAERAQDQLRARTAELRQRYGPALGLAAAPSAALEPGSQEPDLSGAPAGPSAVVRVVRWERVVLAGGTLLVFVGGVRRRRRRRAGRRG
ncbi:DUF3618 domain-containing protein [Frankia sp. AiPa1]|uniref:DUF3618 domain-containing protein n=1 Tax=Frankia sp. AiPa1 TaxID=573492 RepID=UPI00202B0BFE|nr:DUF3618 domain-containing protein [Frankia sp. AiPa1]MCL9762412.1 DUF3618 domain-containing protein [Frankia sp. AiPa1]